MLQDAQVMNIVSGLSPFYPQLLKEFIVNISKDFNKNGSEDYRKVHVHGYCIGLSPVIINDYLCRRKLVTTSKVCNMNTISQEITRGNYEDWPRRGLLLTTNLSVKYATLNRIRVAN